MLTTHTEFIRPRPARRSVRRPVGQWPVGIYWSIALVVSLGMWAGLASLLRWAI